MFDGKIAITGKGSRKSSKANAGSLLHYLDLGEICFQKRLDKKLQAGMPYPCAFKLYLWKSK